MASISGEYRRLIRHIGTTVSVRELATNSSARDTVAMRHDVDHDLDLALEMAWLEAEEGVRSTYYILHTAPYFDHPLTGEKCKQIQDLGHEVAFHNNLLGHYVRSGKSPDDECDTVLGRMREWGLDLVGVSAHGDPLCYEKGFINHCYFAEGNEHFNRAGVRVSAEGIVQAAHGDYIAMKGDRYIDGPRGPVELGRRRLSDLRLVYDASLVPLDVYITDSRGLWSSDPFEVDFRRKRSVLLVHPEHHRGPSRLFLFLGSARSGSKWLTRALNETTTIKARHEFLLNHFIDGTQPVRDFFTGPGFLDRLQNEEEVQRRLLDWEKINQLEDPKADYAEVNVYGVHALERLRATFPGATLVHLHRDGRKVATSLFNRNWYDSPADTHHPWPPGLEAEGLSQFGRCSAYWAWVCDELSRPGIPQLSLEALLSETDDVLRTLAAMGVRVVLPNRFRQLCRTVVDPTTSARVRVPTDWTDTMRHEFAAVAGATLKRLGYEDPSLPKLASTKKLRWREAASPIGQTGQSDFDIERVLNIGGLSSYSPLLRVGQRIRRGVSQAIGRILHRPSASMALDENDQLLPISATPGTGVELEQKLTLRPGKRRRHWVVLAEGNWHTANPETLSRLVGVNYVTTNFSVARMERVTLLTLRHLYYDRRGQLITPYTRCFNFTPSFLQFGPACRFSTCPPQGAAYVALGINLDSDETTDAFVEISELSLDLARCRRAA